MPIRQPDQEAIFTYIHGTHEVERIRCVPSEIAETYSGKAKIPNPFADGHLRAINYIFTNLAGQLDFPAKSPDSLENPFQAELAANWLNNLHSLAFSPLLRTHTSAEDPNAPKPGQVGRLRSVDAWNTFSQAPSPQLIKPIIKNWLKDLAILDKSVRGKIDQPYGITQKQAQELEKAAYRSSLLISVTQPYTYGNNRLGRLVENALRIHWGFRWKTIMPGSDYEKYTEDLVEFQGQELKEIMAKARESLRRFK